ncbi:hypothetical protein ACFWZ4_12990 [Frateuria sp. GZRe12]|uniref:hypothetical protein n=1 Tax=Frateuria sp. GZRe12 TaxID=3351533 RepID=UPI003EDC7193
MRMTIEKLAGLIGEGRGLGAGDHYKPWEQITRKRASPFSNLNIVPVPHLTRLAHFLSRGEREFGLLLWWLGAEDVREQYPLWPWPHRQPLEEIEPYAPRMPKHPGMAALAGDAGIRLGRYPGTNVPVILSLDLLATIPPAVGPHRLVGFSCKPRALFHAAASRSRLRERLELDRRYCAAAAFRHRLVHPEQISKTLVVQLHWLAPIMSKGQLELLIGGQTYQAYLAHIAPKVYELPAHQASYAAAEMVGWSEEQGQQALRLALWYQHIDVDLSQPVCLTRVLKPGGVSLRRELREQWFGGQE